MVGNVYIKFREEESCAAALQALQGRFYDGRPIIVEFRYDLLPAVIPPFIPPLLVSK